LSLGSPAACGSDICDIAVPHPPVSDIQAKIRFQVDRIFTPGKRTCRYRQIERTRQVYLQKYFTGYKIIFSAGTRNVPAGNCPTVPANGKKSCRTSARTAG
jgi:hypothetical protein